MIAPVLAHPVFFVESTSYCQTGRMADGTHTRFGSVASNRHPLHTMIRLVGASFMGRKTFVVRDRIGAYSQLDFFAPSCATATRWGRRRVRYRVIGRAS